MIQGGFHEENFSYVRLRFKICDEDLLKDRSKSCASTGDLKAQKPLRIYLPESSINYKSAKTEKALEWTINSNLMMQINHSSHQKQEIFIS